MFETVDTESSPEANLAVWGIADEDEEESFDAHLLLLAEQGDSTYCSGSPERVLIYGIGTNWAFLCGMRMM